MLNSLLNYILVFVCHLYYNETFLYQQIMFPHLLKTRIMTNGDDDYRHCSNFNSIT